MTQNNTTTAPKKEFCADCMKNVDTVHYKKDLYTCEECGQFTNPKREQVIISPKRFGKSYRQWQEFLHCCENGHCAAYSTPRGDILSPQAALLQKKRHEEEYAKNLEKLLNNGSLLIMAYHREHKESRESRESREVREIEFCKVQPLKERIDVWDHPCTKTAKIKGLTATWWREDLDAFLLKYLRAIQNYDVREMEDLRSEFEKSYRQQIEKEQEENKSEDSKRLDFLEKCHRNLNKHYGTNYKWEFIVNSNVVRLLQGTPHKDIDLYDSACGKESSDSVREAIDKKRVNIYTESLVERERRKRCTHCTEAEKKKIREEVIEECIEKILAVRQEGECTTGREVLEFLQSIK